jgi:hypothetical protein
MKNAIYALCAIVLLGILGGWIAGVRVVVIQPTGAIPKGVTAVVVGLPSLHIVDSPDAFCQRTQGE